MRGMARGEGKLNVGKSGGESPAFGTVLRARLLFTTRRTAFAAPKHCGVMGKPKSTCCAGRGRREGQVRGTGFLSTAGAQVQLTKAAQSGPGGVRGSGGDRLDGWR